MNLVIVESPSKSKTLMKYLGPDFEVMACVGHIRDLPKGKLGIDVDNKFETVYEVSHEKKKVIAQLKAALKKSSKLYLATDPDREGEAISWHLMEVLKPKKIPVHRLVFYEITKGAVQESLKNTREIDQNLVNAQETRRILDRLFGYQVSKELWLNVKGKLSAGRVQSPAIKIIVDREKEREKFIMSSYFSITGEFIKGDEKFTAELKSLNGQKIAKGSNFDRYTGQLKGDSVLHLDESNTPNIVDGMSLEDWNVSAVDTKPFTQSPYPPFITSTLQQDGIRRLRTSAQQIMRIAQSLYEQGFITYMRTDSVHLSDEAVKAARTQVKELYGDSYLSDKPRVYKGKVKNAQEAHEAIRPAGARFQTPDQLRSQLSDQEYRLYDLIWKRTIASQMAAAKLKTTTATISKDSVDFEAKGKTVEFDGFFRAYEVGTDESGADRSSKEKYLPSMDQGDKLSAVIFEENEHSTKPSPRFTEASLVKELENVGIGRPSTYAAIMSKIQDRGYVNKTKGMLIPTFTAYAVVHFLEKYFSDLVDLQFTAQLEDSLDQISNSGIQHSKFLNNFYFGDNESKGLKELLESEFDKEKSRTIYNIKNGSDSDPIKLKIGRYGLYLEHGDKNASIPDDTIPDTFKFEKALELINLQKDDGKEISVHPDSGDPIYIKTGKFGPYLKSGEKMKSFPPGLSIEDMTPKLSERVISLPITIGKDSNNDEVKIDIGRYGPYLRAGKKNKSVPKGIDIFEITIKEAIDLLDKGNGGVLRELGTDESGSDIVIKDGRYGVYITNGKVNVTIPKESDHEKITLEESLELIKNKKPKKRFFKKKK